MNSSDVDVLRLIDDFDTTGTRQPNFPRDVLSRTIGRLKRHWLECAIESGANIMRNSSDILNWLTTINRIYRICKCGHAATQMFPLHVS